MANTDTPRFDLVLRGATVVDPASGLCQPMDVAVTDGRIAAIDSDIPVSAAVKAIQLDDQLLTPGLIDMHCHLYPKFPVGENGLWNICADDHLFQQGVTTAVDAGSCGPRDFFYFKEQVLDRSKVRLYAFVNMADGGMLDFEREQNCAAFVPKVAAAIADTFPRQVVGIKTAHYWVGKPFDDAHPAWASVEAAVEAGELCHKPAMVDFQPTLPGRSYQDLVLKKMRPGDIHTHMYAQQFPVLDENGKVSDFLWQAKKRGIHFDLGHGAGSFLFRNAVPAFQQGYWPDTLSTDLYHDNVAGPVFGLTHILSKYLAMGMDLMEVIRLVTVAPAKVIGNSDIGRLQVGLPADIAVLTQQEGSFGFPDCGGFRMDGTKRLTCALALRNGEVAYDPDARALKSWEEAGI